MILPGVAILLKIISIVISSWVIIHLLAAFGVFLAVSYPVWWFLAPKSTVCLNCQAKSSGEWCGFCNARISKDNHPQNIRSAVYNSFLILFFSVFSMGVVYIESMFVLNLQLLPTSKNAEFVINDKGKYRINEIFPMEINVGAIESPINAVQVDLSFDPNQLEVVEVSTQNSFASVFIDKKIDNNVGYIRLTGGVPNPGYTLDRGLFGTVYFKAKGSGIANVEFLPTSLVLANDSKGTNVLKSYPTASFLILDTQVGSVELTDFNSNVILESNVLGESVSSSGQVHLYLEDRIAKAAQEQAILGATTHNASSTSLRETLLQSIHKLDKKILSWHLNLLSSYF